MKRLVWVIVAAAAAACLARADVTAPNSTGVEPLYAYKGGLNEAINLFNGNLNVVVPILTLKGRAGLDLGISLSYDSRQFKFYTDEDELHATWNYTGQTSGRWVPNFAAYVNEYNVHDGDAYIFYADITIEQGTQHHFRTPGVWTSGPKIGKSTNNTDMQYDFDSKILRMKNGVWYDFSSSSSFKKGEANGNYITYTIDGSGRTTQITDTLGRNVNISYQSGTTLISSITVLNNAGNTLTYSFSYETATGHVDQ